MPALEFKAGLVAQSLEHVEYSSYMLYCYVLGLKVMSANNIDGDSWSECRVLWAQGNAPHEAEESVALWLMFLFQKVWDNSLGRLIDFLMLFIYCSATENRLIEHRGELTRGRCG